MQQRAWKVCAVVLAVAVGLNYPWEMLQTPLYRVEDGGLPSWIHCLRASVGDGLVVLAALVLGALVFRRLDWFRRPGRGGYIWMLTSSLCIAVALEWASVHVLHRWSYSPAMPFLPVLKIGLVPIAQMAVLPPAIFAIAARHAEPGSGSGLTCRHILPGSIFSFPERSSDGT